MKKVREWEGGEGGGEREWCRVSGVGFMVQGFRFRVSGFGFRV
jgi:hypothetical protein